MYILLILGVILFAIIMNNNKQDIIEKNDKKEGATTILSINTTHLGGDPSLKQKQPVTFEARSDGTFRMNLGVGLNIDYKLINSKNIIRCECKTEQDISHDITMGRLIGFGIFALALKKEKKMINTYMILNYKINDITVNCLFGAKDGQKLSQLVYKINEAIMNNKGNLTNEA